MEQPLRDSPSNFRLADELTWPELEALDRDRTVCVCAVSALEVHGPHLPIGSDYHQACHMADETGRRFAERHPDWTVLRYPPLPVGTDELPLPGSMSSPARAVYRVVRAFGDSLAGAGFRYILVTNAHGGPRHAAALEAACRRVSRRRGVAMITPSIRALHRLITGQLFKEVEEVIERPLGAAERHALLNGEHAGAWETSWYLAQRPDLVGPEYATLHEDHPPPLRWLDLLGRRLGGARDPADGALGIGGVLVSLAGSLGWLSNVRFGYRRAERAASGRPERVSYSGDPSAASPEVGVAYAELAARQCLEDLEAVIEGRLDPLHVKSIASEPMVIQPWFLPALGALLAALLVSVALAF